MAIERIKRVQFDDPERAEVHESVARAVEHNPALFIDRYKAQPNTFGGRYVCTDAFKETFNEYGASKDSRNRFNNPVHNPAAVLAAELFRLNLQEWSEPDRDKVIFLTGIPGAGKTSMVMEKGELPTDCHMIFEGQLADPATTLPKIQAVVNAGFKPVIAVVHRQPEEALQRTFRRFEEQGRGASIQAMAKIQGNLPNGLEAVRAQFGNAVELTVFDCTNRKTNTRPLQGWENLNLLRSEGSHEQIEQRLGVALEARRLAGVIDDACYRQAAGKAPLGRMEAASLAGRSIDERGRDLPQEDRQATHMTKQRLLVMNGQKIVQTEQGDNKWRDEKVENAGALKPGYYNLYIAKKADQTATHGGVVVHANGESIYQKTAAGLVEHNRSDFDRVPEQGVEATITYANGKAQAITGGRGARGLSR